MKAVIMISVLIALSSMLVCSGRCDGVSEEKQTVPADLGTNEELRKEIIEMTVTDQAVRSKNIGEMKEDDFAKMREVDQKHEVRMREIVAKYGWPGRTLVGEEGSRDAWLIVQHCSVEFQEQCLPLVKKAVESKELAGKWQAYLQDRVNMYRGKPQVYGTQFMNGKLVPIDDVKNVDARRKSVELEPLIEYVTTVCKMNSWSVESVLREAGIEESTTK